MTSPVIDNSATSDLKKAITWQFDKAENLVGVVSMLDDFFSAAVEKPWNDFGDRVDITQDADAQALAIWGKFLGVPRPSVVVTESVTRSIADEAYRRILVARLRLLHSCGSTDDYIAFLKYVFGSSVKISYADEMSIEFEYDADSIPSNTGSWQYDLYLLFTQNPDAIFEYPAGIKSRLQSIGPVVAFDEQVTMVKDGEIVTKSVAVTEVDITAFNTTQDIVNSVTITAAVTNSYSSTRTIPTGYTIKVDGILYTIDTSTVLPARISTSVPSSTDVTFTATGDHDPTIGAESKIYQSNGTSIWNSSYVNATVSSYEKDSSYARTITIPSGSYITVNGTNYVCDISTTIDSQESAEINFYYQGSTTPSFSTTTIYDDEGTAIDDITATFKDTEQTHRYPDGAEPTVLTGARVFAVLTGDTATIPVGAKTEVNGVEFFTREAKELTPEDNSFVMVAIGNHPIQAGDITNVTDAEGDAISGVSSFSNAKRSVVDFAVDTMDNATIAWARKNP